MTAINAAGAIVPELLQRLREEMAVDKVPGAAIGVIENGRTAVAGLGVTNVDHPLDVDRATLFQIGSVTKTFTAAAIMQLVGESRVDLDDPIRKHLPDFRVADDETSAQASIRECLTHSCGWEGELFLDTGNGADALQRVVERMADLPQAIPRGRMWGYNNAAFYPLGRIIEVIDGTSYEESIARRLFRPLGMEPSGFFAQDLLYHRLAVGHTVVDGEITVTRPWAMPRSSTPVGGIVTSIDGLMAYARFQVEGAPHVLDDALRLAGHQPSGPAEDDPAIGLGWWLEERAGGRVVHHGGGANGQPCNLAMMPERGFAIAVLTNGAGGFTTANRVIDWALGEYADSPALSLPEADSSEDARRAFREGVGDYASLLDRVLVRDDPDGPSLAYQVLGDWLSDPYPATDLADVAAEVVIPAGGDRFVVGQDGRMPSVGTFLRDDAGAIRWLRHELRTFPRAD